MSTRDCLVGCVFLLAACCCDPLGAQGISFYETIRPGDEIVDMPGLDLLVVTVTKVSSHKPTIKKPPVVEVTVDEVLRGKKQPKTLTVLWERTLISPVTPQWKEWLKVTQPKVKEKWILLGDAGPYEGKYAGGKYWTYRRYAYSKAKRKWAVGELARAKRLLRESTKYGSTWPDKSYFLGHELLARARPLTAATKLKPGDPVLVRWATVTRSRVVKVFDDGRIKIRPSGYDSRWDAKVPRKKVLLYPKDVLKEPVPLPKRHTPADIPRYAKAAKRIFVGHIVGGVEIPGKPAAVGYTFQIGRIIKGKPDGLRAADKTFVTLGLSRELGFLLSAREGSYVLFLGDVTHRGPSMTVYQQIELGDGLVRADKATMELLKKTARAK